MLQIMIEAESVEDLKKQALELAASFGGAETVTVSVDKAATAGSYDQQDERTRRDEAQVGGEPAAPPKSEGAPAPTQKTVKMAEEMGIDIADVRGTGKNGRVTQADLKEYAKQNPPPTQEEPATTPSGGDPFAENEDSTPDEGEGTDIEPTKENAKNALRVVHGEKGMDACMKVLQANGARKIGELKEDQYAAFIQNCAEDIGVDVSGLKEKIEALEG